MTRLAHARIERAIRAAEAGTTGHILVRIVPEKNVHALERAKDEFERAGLHRKKERNVAMILVAPNARAYAVLGDRELHTRVGDAFWQAVVDEMRPMFARGKSAEAVVLAIDRIGAALRKEFPAQR